MSQPHCPPTLRFPQEKALGLAGVILGPVRAGKRDVPHAGQTGSTHVLNEQVRFSEMLTYAAWVNHTLKSCLSFFTICDKVFLFEIIKRS